MRLLGTLLLLGAAVLAGQTPETPLVRIVDVDRGEPVEVVLHNGVKARVELLDRSEARDSLRGAVRLARARVKVNGDQVSLECGNYHLPVRAGSVQIDCAVTRGYLTNSRANPWGNSSGGYGDL